MQARLPGQCPSCNHPINVGDRIRKDVHDHWMHFRCGSWPAEKHLPEPLVKEPVWTMYEYTGHMLAKQRKQEVKTKNRAAGPWGTFQE
jgi:hypothetical protein